jgi:hypothetical protein
MKRIIVWVNSKSEGIEEVRKRLEKLLRSMGLRYTIVETCEVRELEDAQ